MLKKVRIFGSSVIASSTRMWWRACVLAPSALDESRLFVCKRERNFARTHQISAQAYGSLSRQAISSVWDGLDLSQARTIALLHTITLFRFYLCVEYSWIESREERKKQRKRIESSQEREWREPTTSTSDNYDTHSLLPFPFTSLSLSIFPNVCSVFFLSFLFFFLWCAFCLQPVSWLRAISSAKCVLVCAAFYSVVVVVVVIGCYCCGGRKRQAKHSQMTTTKTIIIIIIIEIRKRSSEENEEWRCDAN